MRGYSLLLMAVNQGQTHYYWRWKGNNSFLKEKICLQITLYYSSLKLKASEQQSIISPVLQSDTDRHWSLYETCESAGLGPKFRTTLESANKIADDQKQEPSTWEIVWFHENSV